MFFTVVFVVSSVVAIAVVDALFLGIVIVIVVTSVGVALEKHQFETTDNLDVLHKPRRTPFLINERGND